MAGGKSTVIGAAIKLRIALLNARVGILGIAEGRIEPAIFPGDLSLPSENRLLINAGRGYHVVWIAKIQNSELWVAVFHHAAYCPCLECINQKTCA